MLLQSAKQSILKRTNILIRNSFTPQAENMKKTRAICGTLQTSSPSQTSVNNGPLKKYSSLLESGALEPDRHQFIVVKHLQLLYNSIAHQHEHAHYSKKTSGGYEYELARKPPFCDSFYIYGEVGTGKTFLLDLIYECLPIRRKKRVHFHAFMVFLYSEFNRWNLCTTNENSSAYLSSPIEYIANKLMEDAWIICFDEMQLTDYGSCSLLHGILSNLLSKGALIIATSNRSIDDLGDSSITESNSNTSEHLHSLKGLLKKHCVSLKLDSINDYRSSMKTGRIAYAYPVSKETEEWLDQTFSRVVGVGNSLETRYITVYGRKVPIPLSTTDGVARFTATELFQKHLGPADYIQLCNNYHTVFIDRIPRMGMAQRNAARRFLSFIDAAYESRTKLYCTAECQPEDIFTLLPQEQNDVDSHENQMHFEMIGEIAYDLALSQIDYKSLGIVSGEDEIFSFKRAISRLKEMQSSVYQMKPHQKQLFDPYVGTAEERKRAIERRHTRMSKRQEIRDEIEYARRNGDNITQLREDLDDVFMVNALRDHMKEEWKHKRIQELDWGDEASFTFSNQAFGRQFNHSRAFEKFEMNRKLKETSSIFNVLPFLDLKWWKSALRRIVSSSNDAIDR